MAELTPEYTTEAFEEYSERFTGEVERLFDEKLVSVSYDPTAALSRGFARQRTVAAEAGPAGLSVFHNFAVWSPKAQPDLRKTTWLSEVEAEVQLQNGYQRK